jgi:hypothetical protein
MIRSIQSPGGNLNWVGELPMLTRLSLAAVVLGLLTPFLQADEEVQSGPDVGKKVPALKVHAVTGIQENKDLDYAAKRKDKPTIYVFIQADKWSRPMARFLKTLEKQVQKESEDAYLVAVWLTEKPDATKKYLPVAQESLKFEITALTFFKGEKTGPKGWGLNADAFATVVVAHKQKVVARFGYMSINETDAPRVRAALRKSLKKSK